MSFTGIRAATLDDVTTLAQFRIALATEDGPVDASSDFLERCLTWFAAELATGAFRAQLAFDAGEVVGSAGFRIRTLLPQPTPGPALEARVHTVYVVPAYRNRGIGSALVEAVLAEIERTGPYLRVNLGARARARSLYERLGFVASSEMQLPRPGSDAQAVGPRESEPSPGQTAR